MKKIVECRNIYKNYYQGKIEIPVLKNINFTVEEGDYTAIIASYFRISSFWVDRRRWKM